MSTAATASGPGAIGAPPGPDEIKAVAGSEFEFRTSHNIIEDQESEADNLKT